MDDAELKAAIYQAFDVDETDPLVVAFERLAEVERALLDADRKNMEARIKAVPEVVTAALYAAHPDLPAGLRFKWVSDG